LALNDSTIYHTLGKNANNYPNKTASENNTVSCLLEMYDVYKICIGKMSILYIFMSSLDLI